jgi:hypothetical protein
MPKAQKVRAMPKFEPAPPELIRLFEGAIKDFPQAEERKMFGYPAAVINGQMFSSLFGENMMLRLSQADREKFLREYKSKLFEPMPGRPMKEYVLVPLQVRESPALLKGWLTRSSKYAESLPPKVKGKKAR